MRKTKRRIKESIGRRIFVVCNYSFMILFLMIYLFPLINVLAASLSSAAAVSAGKVVLWPVDFTFNAYLRVLDNPRFLGSIFNSVKRVALGVPINLLMAICMAYPLSRSESVFKARKFFMPYLLITMMFYGGLIPSYIVVIKAGLYDTIWSLILPYAVPAFNVILLLNFFRELPKEIEESAFIDGAGHWTVLFKIYLPLSKAVLATLTLFFFVYHWNSWLDGIIYMRTPEHYPLQSYLQTVLKLPDLKFMTPQELVEMYKVNQRSVKAAQVFVATLPILLIYPFLQKYFTKGVVLGSVKG